MIAFSDVAPNQDPLGALPEWLGSYRREAGLDRLTGLASLDQVVAELLKGVKSKLMKSLPFQERPLLVTVA